jgi:hypothetical protein
MQSICRLFIVVLDESFRESFEKREGVGHQEFKWFSVFFEKEFVVFNETLQTEKTAENFVELFSGLETGKDSWKDGLPASREVIASNVKNDDFDLFAEFSKKCAKTYKTGGVSAHFMRASRIFSFNNSLSFSLIW